MRRFIIIIIIIFSERAACRGAGGVLLPDFFFLFPPCSADHERDWPPRKVVVFGLASNALNVRNNNSNKVWVRSDFSLNSSADVRMTSFRMFNRITDFV